MDRVIRKLIRQALKKLPDASIADLAAETGVPGYLIKREIREMTQSRKS